MSVGYTGIGWNRQKRWYDLALVGGILLGLGGYVAVSLSLRPQLTAETLIIRGTALTAFGLLHVILCIGPLARLDRRFLPLLFNRRHLGVTMFLLAFVHAAFSIFQFHALGNLNPLVSLFTAYRMDYAGISHFPFEPFGFVALVILFLMAATSHDFWLRNLGPSVWKALHILVLAAYGLLVLHVAYGALQSERSPVYPLLLGLGCVTVFGLHVAAARREVDPASSSPEQDGFVRACAVEALREGVGKSGSRPRALERLPPPGRPARRGARRRRLRHLPVARLAVQAGRRLQPAPLRGEGRDLPGADRRRRGLGPPRAGSAGDAAAGSPRRLTPSGGRGSADKLESSHRTRRNESMAYPIEEIEGIGPAFREKLQVIGIGTTDDLLDQGCTPEGRKSIAEKTEISEQQILGWTNMADLMRVSGIGRQYAELLEASGVDTIKELRNRNAENLATRMEEVNAEMNLANATPSTSTIEGWIDQAKQTSPKIRY
jgi:DMSO/TMAO reductase YedYZ heme-binding membrane subunit/predicted flap endonuclease-1-like 5' DNA nuclease